MTAVATAAISTPGVYQLCVDFDGVAVSGSPLAVTIADATVAGRGRRASKANKRFALGLSENPSTSRNVRGMGMLFGELEVSA